MFSYSRNLRTFVLPIAACLLPVGAALADTQTVAPIATRVAMVSSVVKAAPAARAQRARLDLRAPDVSKLPLLMEMSDAGETREPMDIAVINVSAAKRPDFHVSRAGVGSVYWVTHHPAQGWMLFAPLATDKDTRLYRDVTVQCEMLANSSQYQTGCP